MCVCVCVCVRARMCVRAYMYVTVCDKLLLTSITSLPLLEF